jgi:hypothetical protein
MLEQTSMYDISAPKASGHAKLLEWRKRYSAADYPGRVVLNMFYELLGIEGIWPDILDGFQGSAVQSSFSEAMTTLITMKRQFQGQILHPQLLHLLERNTPAADTTFSDWRDRIAGAASGDNACVVEIEYGYWFYNQYCAATLAWGACGLLGLSRQAAFLEVSGGMVGDGAFDTFEELLGRLCAVMGATASSIDWRGKPVDLGDIMSGRVGNYYPSDFPILPPLWPCGGTS